RVFGEIDQFVEVVLLDVLQELGLDGPAVEVAGGKGVVRAVVVVQGECHLVQVVGAGHAGGRLADFLHGRQQQTDEDRDDGDHHQQLDKGEAATDRAPAIHGRNLIDLALALRTGTVGVHGVRAVKLAWSYHSRHEDKRQNT